MEFVEGPSLKKRLGSGPLALAEVRILQRRVASALGAAHQHGVVHRDISPDNLIMPDGATASAALQRGVNRRTGDVIPDNLVRGGTESVCPARRINGARLSAGFDPIDQRRQKIESIRRSSAGAVVHVRDRIESRELLGRLQAAELLRHLVVVHGRAGNRRARIAQAASPAR